MRLRTLVHKLVRYYGYLAIGLEIYFGKFLALQGLKSNNL